MESFVYGMEPLMQIDEVRDTRWVTITARGPQLHKLTTKHLNANKSDSRLVKAMTCAMLSKLQDHTTWILIHQKKKHSTKGFILGS